MAKSRVAPTAQPMSMNETCEVSVRRIDNGYIVRTSTYGSGPDGYTSSEVFSKEKPKAQILVSETEEPTSGRAAPSRLRAATTMLNRRRK